MRKAAWWFALGGALELGMAVAGAKLGALPSMVLGWTLAVSIEGAGALLFFAWLAVRRVSPNAGPTSPSSVVDRQSSAKKPASETDRLNAHSFDADSRHVGSLRFHLEHRRCE
jgi:hypothetical protein